MMVVAPGHVYKLDTLDELGRSSDGRRTWDQRLVFVQRVGDKYPGNVQAHPGTTSQEVLRSLIDRSRYVNNQNPCMETEAVVGLLEAALVLLELRAARRRGEHLNFSRIATMFSAPIGLDGHVR